jgi:(2Fe-2S) ferredoxin
MKTTWRTAWQGPEIVVYREDEVVDRVNAHHIERVVFVHHGSGDSPGDLFYAIAETADEALIFPDFTGFSGRVNFERQAYWAERGCVYWVSDRHVSLPPRLRRGRWFLRAAGPQFARVPRAELASLIAGWPLEGPQTWEQRKWRRIENSRPFSNSAPGQLRA